MIRCNTLIIEVALLGDFFCGWMWGHGLLHSAYLAARPAWVGAIRARMVGVLPDAPWVILLCCCLAARPAWVGAVRVHMVGVLPLG